MYSTQDGLNLSPERLSELTESDSQIGIPDQSVISKLGLRANGRVDGALAKIYVTPIASPLDIVVSVELAIWKYLLYTHREVMQVPDSVKSDYEWAMAQLELWRTDAEPLDAPARTTFVGAMVL